MKMKLAYKVFLGFFVTSAVIAGLLVGMQFHVLRNFSEYVGRAELNTLQGLEERLLELYREQGSWDDLRRKPRIWHKLLAEEGILPHPFPGSPPGPVRRPLRSSEARIQEDPNRGTVEPDRFDDPPPPPPSHTGPRLVHLGPRLALFDEAGDLVVGAPSPAREFTVKPLLWDKRTVGWIGLHRAQQISDPLAEAFRERQSSFLYVTGAAALLLTALVTLILSRQILGPVRALTRGTHALVSRQFHTRIEVRSKDELGRLAEDFNTMARTLERYEQLRQQWMTDISHELRTPLSILRGEIEALQDGVREANMDTLASLHSEVVRIGKLVDDLHLLSLADSGNLLQSRSRTDLMEALGETVDLFRGRLEQRGLALEWEVKAAPLPKVEADADRLKQVFTNILENALRYADAPGTVRIVAHDSGGAVTIDVEDSGPGVPPESLPRLFDRLYRVDHSRSRRSGGSGLGLAICKRIVESQGGRIEADPSEQGGLRIRVSFPKA